MAALGKAMAKMRDICAGAAKTSQDEPFGKLEPLPFIALRLPIITTHELFQSFELLLARFQAVGLVFVAL